MSVKGLNNGRRGGREEGENERKVCASCIIYIYRGTQRAVDDVVPLAVALLKRGFDRGREKEGGSEREAERQIYNTYTPIYAVCTYIYIYI